jgi:hypothetical protein
MKKIFFFALLITTVIQMSGQGSKSVSIKTISLSDPTKKTLYFRIENELQLSAKGIPSEKLLLKINKRIISGNRGIFQVKVSPKDTIIGKKIIIKVAYLNKSNDTIVLSQETFNTINLRDPMPMIAGKNSGTISKEELINADSISLEMPDCLLKNKFKVISFSLSISKGIIQEYKQNNGSTITEEQKEIIKSLKNDQKIFFENIKASANGYIVVCPVIAFKIKE